MRLELAGLAARHPAAGAAGAAPALMPVSLTIERGEQVAVIGPSGAGKTTLLHALACALRPSQGTLRLDGLDPWTLSVGALQKLRGSLFLGPQAPPLPPRQRVITAVLAGRLPRQSLWESLRSLAYPDDIEGARRALAAFDLEDKLWERVDRLSGGERQRVGLARALVAPATLWLVDEPLSSLDPARATLAIDTLTREAKARGVTLIASLHQVDVTRRFERVVGLRDGAMQFDLAGAAVSPAQLAALYAQREHELGGPTPPVPQASTAPGPVPGAILSR